MHLGIPRYLEMRRVEALDHVNRWCHFNSLILLDELFINSLQLFILLCFYFLINLIPLIIIKRNNIKNCAKSFTTYWICKIMKNLIYIKCINEYPLSDQVDVWCVKWRLTDYSWSSHKTSFKTLFKIIKEQVDSDNDLVDEKSPVKWVGDFKTGNNWF